MNNIVIRDIAPRLTGQAHPLSTSDKIELIDSLTGAGIRAVEVSSFVRPDLIPGLADADDVFAGIQRRPDVSLDCCVGNERGLRRAIDAGADAAYFLLSADESFAHNNIGKSTDESLRELERINELASTSSITVGTYIIFAWGGPSGPPRRPADLQHLTRRLLDIGVEHWILADSCGYASPRAMRETTMFALEQLKDPNTLTVQIHDGRGMGLANTVELVKAGVTHIDTSLAGSGGHPAMPTTPGAGVCTEDVVQLLHLEGVPTGIDLAALVEISNRFVDTHRIPSNGFVRIPGPVPTAGVEANPPADFAWRTA